MKIAAIIIGIVILILSAIIWVIFAMAKIAYEDELHKYNEYNNDD